MAVFHSSGWRALRTNTRMTISTVPGCRSCGSVLSGEVRSHTEACIFPIGGEMYSGLFFVCVVRVNG